MLDPHTRAEHAVVDQKRHTVPRSAHNIPYPLLDNCITDIEKECWDIACSLTDKGYLVEAKRHFLAVLSHTVLVEQAHYKKGRFILC